LLAALLCLALLAFWTLLGFALLAPRDREQALPALLLAPAVGIALTLVPVFCLNRLGVPVARFGWPLLAALAAGCALRLWRARPAFDPRAYAPFAAVLLLAFWLTGRPMLRFGFDWVSFANEDMTNYCLSAHRFLDHGFGDQPSAAELLSGRDYSQYYWFVHVPAHVRPGADLILAWVLSLTGLSGPQAFMPVLLAFHLALLGAGAALAFRGGGVGPAWWACLLLAASALTTLGALYQLIAQVAGLALLAACVAVAFRPMADLSRRAAAGRGLLIGLLGSGLALVYPEVLPFLVVGYAAYLAASFRAWWPARGRLLTALAIGVAASLLVLNRSAIGLFRFLLEQGKFGALNQFLSDLFPYYLMPSGLVQLWGWNAIGAPLPAEPLLSVLIVLGGLLLAFAGAAAVWLARRGSPAAALVVVMLGVGVWLFFRPDGFGLMKLAMFAQPFLLASLVLALWRVIPRLWLRVAVLVVLALAGVPAQYHYVWVSRGNGAALLEAPNPSRLRLGTALQESVRRYAPRRIVSDTYIVSVGKLQAVATRGIDAAFPSITKFPMFFAFERPQIGFDPDLASTALGLQDAICDRLPLRFFDLHAEGGGERTNVFRIVDIGLPRGPFADGNYLLCGTHCTSILNRRHSPAQTREPFLLRPAGEVRNHLVFQFSKLGQLTSGGDYDVRRAGLHALQPDIWYPGRTMAGCGRHHLYLVLNPSETVRVQLDVTACLNYSDGNRLPPAAVVGDARRRFPLVGRGSARVFSPPVRPQFHDGLPFIAVDMGAAGADFHPERHGLMALYGRRYGGDHRRLAAFLRDVSLVSEEEYARLRPPTRVHHFPAGLRHPDLEYAGIYEDGWVSEHAFFNLASPARHAALTLRGCVPRGDEPGFSTELAVLLDGAEVCRRTLAVGEFNLHLPVRPRDPARTRVELCFSRTHHLPGGDPRPGVARMSEIGFTEQPEPEENPER
jgi:hypothetical protein